jgi:thiamine kinase-like enzyme
MHDRGFEDSVGRAWSRFEPKSRPAQIRPIFDGSEREKGRKHKKKSAVFRLVAAGSEGSDVIAKRCKRRVARLERLIHSEILPGACLPSLKILGVLEQPRTELAWLFMEDAGGREYVSADNGHYSAAVRWLARLHTSCALEEALEPRLRHRNLEYFRDCLDSGVSAIRTKSAEGALSREDRELLDSLTRRLEAVRARWSQIVEVCHGVPSTLVHGDFVAKNIRVRGSRSRIQLLVLDWDAAGWGTPALDLASLWRSREPRDARPYWKQIKAEWPELTIEKIDRLTLVGRVFRLLRAIHWTESRLLAKDGVRMIPHLASYEVDLAFVSRELDWT